MSDVQYHVRSPRSCCQQYITICQGRDEKSTSRFRGGIRLPASLGLPAGKAAYEAGIKVLASAEVLLFSFYWVAGCLIDN